MPKAFTNIEKEHIRNRLKENGTELFLKYGIKRTTVDDLVKLAGISKGSFFSFFSSKEELFFILFSENYTKLNDEFKKQLADTKVPLKKVFTSYLINRFTVDKNPLLSVFYNHEDFEYLNRKISQEKLSEFITNDFNDLISIITKAQKKHKIIKYEPLKIVEIFHALFYISVMKQDMQRFNKHEQDITEVFIEIIVNYFITD
jgi:AcrR family transcriptional regulator